MIRKFFNKNFGDYFFECYGRRIIFDFVCILFFIGFIVSLVFLHVDANNSKAIETSETNTYTLTSNNKLLITPDNTYAIENNISNTQVEETIYYLKYDEDKWYMDNSIKIPYVSNISYTVEGKEYTANCVIENKLEAQKELKSSSLTLIDCMVVLIPISILGIFVMTASIVLTVKTYSSK